MGVNDLCVKVGSKLSSVAVAECQRHAFIGDGSWSQRGWPLVYKDYPPLNDKTPLGRVLLIGGIHGDEYSAVSVPFKWMMILDKYHSGLFHWRFLPVANPDGLLRKRSVRTNERGVDLNRNFATPDWKANALKYWNQRVKKDPRRYPGKAAESEAETRWLARHIAEFKPDVIVSVHAPYGILDYDGPKSPPRRLGYLNLRLLGVYPGSLGNYAGVHLNIPVVTIELPHAGIMPPPEQISQIWVDLVRWLRRHLEKS